MTSGNTWDDKILDAIGMIIEGRYLSVPQGDCAITRKLRAVAERLELEAKASLSGTVDMSGLINTAVIHAAQMMAEIAEVDRRAQGVTLGGRELAASVTAIAAAADAAARDAEAALAGAEQGREAAGKAIATMDSIAAAVADTVGNLDGLAEATAAIADVASQIQAVAKRINLLSLNASVEASRAGDHGRGFTVVARDVATLAGRSAEAGGDIRRRLRTLRAELAGIVDAMADGAAAVAHGGVVIGRTGEDARTVAAGLDGIARRMGEVSEILAQQTRAVDEVSGSIAGVADMASADVARIAEVIGTMHGAARTVARSMAFFNSIEIIDKGLFLAKSDHMIWRARLADALMGKTGLRDDELRDVRACRFGRWYYGVHDPQLRAHPAFVAIEAVHDQVHALGCQVVDLHGQGDLAGALDALKAMESQSVRLVGLLDQLLARDTNG